MFPPHLKPTLLMALPVLVGCDPDYEMQEQYPVLALSTSVIDFAEVVVGKQSTIGIAVDNEGRGDLIVSNLMLDGTTSPDFTLVGLDPTTIEPGGSGVLSAQYVPGAVGQDYGRIAFNTNDPVNILAQVDLVGFGVEPHIELDPEILWFGDLSVGQVSTLVATVSAAGTGTTFIDDIRLEDETLGYSFLLPDNFTTPPYALPAGFSFEIQVTFAPIQETEADTNLVFTSNDPLQPTAAVRLLGNSEEDPTKNTPPTVEITSPDWGNYLVEGELAVLVGNAIDIEDGPELLVCGWSGGGKNLGVGAPDATGTVSLTTTDLPVGEISITLRCMDTLGEIGEDSVQVTVWDQEEPIQYVLSGGDTVYDYWAVDDDVAIEVDGVPIFTDTNHTQDNHPPVEFQAKKGSTLRVYATDFNPTTRTLGALTLHFGTGASQPLSDAVCSSADNVHPCYDPTYEDHWPPYVFFDQTWTIEIP